MKKKKMTGQTLICLGNTIGIKNVNWEILLECREICLA